MSKVDLNWVATKTEHEIFQEKVDLSAEEVEQLSNEVSAYQLLFSKHS